MSLEERRVYQEACIRCSQCKFVPAPKSKAFSSICPSIDYGQFHAYSGGGKVITSYALVKNNLEATPRLIDSVFACTMCGACDTACKTNEGDNVEPMDTMYALRAHLAKAGNVPPVLRELVERMLAQGSHLGPRHSRNDWAVGLSLTNASQGPVDVLLHIGGEVAFDKAQWPSLRTTIKIMQKTGIDFGMAMDDENDGGGTAYDIGYQDVALEMAQALAEVVRKSHAELVVTTSAQAYSAFRNIYPRLGVELGAVEVLHVSDYLERLLQQGVFALTGKSQKIITYHDPCKLGRMSETYVQWQGKWINVLNTLSVPDSTRPVRFGNGGNYESARQTLSRVPGLTLVEMERNRAHSYCCGASAGTPQAYPEMAEMAAINRLKEAQATGASCLVTSCAGCELHLRAIAQRNNFQIEVKGVLEVVADHIQWGQA